MEVFSSGTKYGSMDEYRRQKIQNVIQETISESDADKDFDLFLKTLLENYSAGNLKDLTEEELRSILKNLRSGASGLKDDRQISPEFTQMKEMLREYNQTHPDSVVELNPQKIKTIIIKPSANSDGKPSN